MKTRSRLLGCVVCGLLSSGLASAQAAGPELNVAVAQSSAASVEAEGEKEPSPEQKMESRFPQPIRVGDLIGLPVLDWLDSTIGFVAQVVRTPDGKVQLVVPYRAAFGWGPFDWGRRPVAVPIETVAILGRQIGALDMPREAFDAAPTFTASQAVPVAPDEMIRIAITRR